MPRIIELDQGSPEWHEYRRTHIGASDAPIIMGMSPWTSAHELWQQKLGYKESKIMTPRMQRGHNLEPEARKICNEHFCIDFIPKVFESISMPFLSASLDGITEDGEILLEIKCPNDDAHMLALNGEIKEYYMCQIQHQFLVTRAKECLYMSYNPENKNPIAYVDIYPDYEFIEKMLHMELKFWDCYKTQEEFTP